jgi:voltage-gated potassium channel
MKQDEFEDKILRRVAVSVYLIAILVIIIAYLIKDVVPGGFKESMYIATSIITQIYVMNPEYGSFIFLFAFIGKILTIYIIYILIVLFNEGYLKQSIMEARIVKKINKLKNHYIICGGGRVGGRVAEDLMKMKKDFVIIDRDAEKVEEYKRHKMLAILGDSLDSTFLTQAQIKNSKCIISCLNSDGDNILQIIVAKKINNKIKIVARASHEKFVDNLKNAGADQIIIPEIIGGREMAQSAMKI